MKLRRILTAATVAIGSVTAVMVVAPHVASAHHPVISTESERGCGDDSPWTARFLAESDADYDKNWRNRHAWNGDAFTDWSGWDDDQTDYGWFELDNIPASTASVTVTVESEWVNKGGSGGNATASRTATIERPAADACYNPCPWNSSKPADWGGCHPPCANRVEIQVAGDGPFEVPDPADYGYVSWQEIWTKSGNNPHVKLASAAYPQTIPNGTPALSHVDLCPGPDACPYDPTVPADTYCYPCMPTNPNLPADCDPCDDYGPIDESCEPCDDIGYVDDDCDPCDDYGPIDESCEPCDDLGDVDPDCEPCDDIGDLGPDCEPCDDIGDYGPDCEPCDDIGPQDPSCDPDDTTTTTTTSTTSTTTTSTVPESSTTSTVPESSTTSTTSTSTSSTSTTTTEGGQLPPATPPTTQLVVPTTGGGPALPPQLPATGAGNTDRLVLIAGLLLGAGTLAMVATRRRRPTTDPT